ncbi:MAG: response regulator [Cytophagaceae bacterium]
MKKFNCVMLIDDDGVTNFINYRLIKKLDITDSIESSINGNEALNFLKRYSLEHDSNCPELILLDLNMPVMDGFEFLNLFKNFKCKNKKDIKVIVLTTSTHQKDIDAIIRDKNIGYITKPLTEKKLFSYINNEISTCA